MADEDDLYYLQPGYDIGALTVPRLRSILVAHDVNYPASAKKGQLVEIVQNEILPKAKKLLKERDRVRRTSKGITDMSSQEDTVNGDGEDRELMPPPPAPKTPRSRKSKSNLTGDDVATPSTSRRSKTPSTRKSTSKIRKSSDTETEADKPKPSVRKSRKSVIPADAATLGVSINEPDAQLKRESLEADATSPFSDDNPFQSGSSPASASRRVSSTSRSRKSAGTSGRKSTSSRRETTSPTIVKQGEDNSLKSTYRFPVTRISSDEPEDGVYTTEEFTPAAAQELVEEANGQLVRKRSAALVRRNKKKPASAVAKATPWAVLTSILAGIGGWYRQEKINVGYCGVGEPNWSLASNPHIPAWIHENLQPVCEPCPQHAICYSNMELKCEDDFVMQPHPLSLNGLVPLPPTCLPDSEKEKRIKAVADRAVEELRSRRAAYECGGDISTSTSQDRTEPSDTTLVKHTETKLEIPEEELRKEVGKLRRKGMSEEEFEDLWRGALGDIKSRDEIKVIEDESGRILISSSSLAKLPFGCAVRRWTIRTIAAYRITIALLILLGSGAGYTRYRVISYKQATAQIPSLVATTLDRLATQAALKEDGRVNEGFISVGQLRDDVLRNVFSARERERVWQGVRKVVEGNSNVRAATREGGKTGEWSRVWEWIGPVDLASGIEGRRSGGLIHNNSPATPDESALQRSDIAIRKWDEGRAIY